MGKHSAPRSSPLAGSAGSTPARSRRSHRSRSHRTPWLAATVVPLGVLAAAATTTAGAGQSAAPLASSVDPIATPAPNPPPADAAASPTKAQPPAPPVAPAPPPPPTPPVSVTSGAVPEVNYAAYRDAAQAMSHTDPGCGIAWSTIAGIGRVESHHANNGDVNPATGDLRAPIYGPTLNGTLAGNEVITDTDGGALDGDSRYDRAVGSMQFLPSTWEIYAADGNGDGKADPQNVFDAALTTATYLCDDHGDLRDPHTQVSAILRYNNSMDYVDDVLGYARTY
ncbi:lytic transglycosylase domain-containing protein [Gordonia mangrovi]|uniref:lytic transglycosylase domain-containing protein n=1 Tax=Gordonia mangrovi TaxID=2665643 RepID=UPI0035A00972